LISVKLHDRLLWTGDSWAGHRRVKKKENLDLLFAALLASSIIGYYSKMCILQFWMWHVLCFRQRMWVMHNNGWRFLCIEVHRDCSSWKQYWTVWRLEAISSEGMYFCSTVVLALSAVCTCLKFCNSVSRLAIFDDFDTFCRSVNFLPFHVS